MRQRLCEFGPGALNRIVQSSVPWAWLAGADRAGRHARSKNLHYKIVGRTFMETLIAGQLTDFITTAYLFGDESRLPEADESLLEAGVLDSTGVLELIEFLEDTFEISVEDSETIPENLDSIAGLSRYISAKRAEGAA